VPLTAEEVLAEDGDGGENVPAESVEAVVVKVPWEYVAGVILILYLARLYVVSYLFIPMMRFLAAMVAAGREGLMGRQWHARYV